MPRRLTKKAASLAHFRKRVRQRFGIILNKRDIDDILYQIHYEPFTHKGTISSRLKCHLVSVHQGVLIYVLYDNQRKVPVTALTRAMWLDYKKERLSK